jgi:hypothetical protein
MSIHTFQLHDLEIGALHDLLLDAVSDTKWKIKELRQTFDQTDQAALLEKLSSIEFNKARLETYTELLEQIDASWCPDE